jgi:RNase H-fold protein (predicted Holliday junction resolvase)
VWDERLSTVEAERTLAGSRPDKRIDRLAAVIICRDISTRTARGV